MWWIQPAKHCFWGGEVYLCNQNYLRLVIIVTMENKALKIVRHSLAWFLQAWGVAFPHNKGSQGGRSLHNSAPPQEHIEEHYPLQTPCTIWCTTLQNTMRGQIASFCKILHIKFIPTAHGICIILFFSAADYKQQRVFHTKARWCDIAVVRLRLRIPFPHLLVIFFSFCAVACTII